MKRLSAKARREAVGILTAERGLGVTRACGLVGISRSLYRYRSRLPPAPELRKSHFRERAGTISKTGPSPLGFQIFLGEDYGAYGAQPGAEPRREAHPHRGVYLPRLEIARWLSGNPKLLSRTFCARIQVSNPSCGGSMLN